MFNEGVYMWFLKMVTDCQDADSLTNLITCVVIYCSYSCAFWSTSLWAPGYMQYNYYTTSLLMDGQLFIISENDGLLTDSEVKAKTLYIIMNDFTVSSNTGINGSNKIVPSCSSTVKVFPY